VSMTLSSTVEYLKSHDGFLILTHKNPDGDAVGSASALCRALRAIGKHAAVFPNPGFTSRYAAYLNGLTNLDFTPSCIVAVDIADAKLIPAAAEKHAGNVALAIDHHGTHKTFAEHLFLDSDAAACGEIIYHLVRELDAELTTEIASALYVAVSTDTGCFLHSSTTAESHRIAAKLLSTGVDIVPIHRDFFITKSRARLAVEANLIDSMHFYHSGKAAIMQLSLELIDKTQATEDDLDNISALARAVEGVELGILIREMADGTCKLSVRSGERVNAAELCAEFDGGGHIRAAGCTINASPKDAEIQLISAIERLKIFS